VFHHRRRFGWPFVTQRFRYRANNGRTLWANPRYYLGRPVFTIGVLGMTAYIVLSLIWLRVFLWGAAGYGVAAVLFSLPSCRRDWRLPFVLPFAHLTQHVVYYVGIVWGAASILWTAPRIVRMRRWRRRAFGAAPAAGTARTRPEATETESRAEARTDRP